MIPRNASASEKYPGTAEPQLRIDVENTKDIDIKGASCKEAAK
jgi:hypothetical protein